MCEKFMLQTINESNQVISNNMIQNFLNMKEVQSITGKSRSTINRWIAKGSFPRPIKLGENSIAWPAEAVTAWRESLINQSTSIVGSY